MSELDQIYIGTAIPNAPKHTGFVPNLVDPETTSTQAFKLFQTHYENPRLPFGATFQQQATIRIHTATPLNQLYFSDQNIEYLQSELRHRVWVASNQKHTIERQNPEDLKTVMRSYYLQYSFNNPDRVKEELNELNERVLAYTVDMVMVEINQYLKYRKDILNYPEQISRPINANMVGTKSAEFKRFF
jgi:hypothetical protein